jgi:hypothetical protein
LTDDGLFNEAFAEDEALVCPFETLLYDCSGGADGAT